MRNLVLSPIFFACRYISTWGWERIVLLSRRAVIDREPATGPTLLRLQAISKWSKCFPFLSGIPKTMWYYNNIAGFEVLVVVVVQLYIRSSLCHLKSSCSIQKYNGTGCVKILFRMLCSNTSHIMIWKSYKFFESVALPSLRIKKMYTSMVGEYMWNKLR